MTKAKTETPEDQAPAVETTQDATIPATETPVGEGADTTDLDALEAAAAEANAKAEAEAAEAEAAAQAAADAQAKAAADAKAAAKAAQQSEAGREGRLAKLNDLLTEVELGNTAETRDQLVEDLAAGHGGELTEDVFSLADITVLRAGTLDRTLADWCMDARRQIMALA